MNNTQLNTGGIDEVFLLLCPVREKDWLDGWDYRMIYSQSGLAEKDCVFATSHHGKYETIWHITQYDRPNHKIEFLRVTPSENVVRINIDLEEIDTEQTNTKISYQYTSLSEEVNRFIEADLEKSFLKSMDWWEKAINHYLINGEMLKQGK